MYVIERGTSAWLCGTVIEAFEVQAVQIRLQGELKNFAVFEQRLAKGECVKAGVIQVYKCNDSSNCEDCTRYTACEVLQKVQETAKAHTEFTKLVEDNGGYTF